MCQYPVHQKGIGACIQCTFGSCVRAYHVTCGLIAGLHVKLDEKGELETYCFTHDPVIREQKRKEKKEKREEESVKKFVLGSEVLARFGGWLYEGIVIELLPEQSGCMVKFYEEYGHM